jgi:hypothetical protein
VRRASNPVANPHPDCGTAAPLSPILLLPRSFSRRMHHSLRDAVDCTWLVVLHQLLPVRSVEPSRWSGTWAICGPSGFCRQAAFSMTAALTRFASRNAGGSPLPRFLNPPAQRQPHADPTERRTWLSDALARFTRPVRHRGNHKYAWALAHSVRRPLPDSMPYPKRADPPQ